MGKPAKRVPHSVSVAKHPPLVPVLCMGKACAPLRQLMTIPPPL